MRRRYYILSFLIPIIILGIYIGIVGGNLSSLFINDLNEQYIFLFDYWKQILNGEQSLFYSFHIGLGQSFLGTYAYYLASPFNWLLFFVSEKYILSFVSILIFVKIGLCGLCMFFYLQKTNQNKDRINLLFSLCYSLMSFVITYYFNIMWLDIIILTPLVILGLEKLIKEGKNKLYVITIFLCILSQYYMAFMLGIFCVVYFIYKAYVLEKLTKNTIKKFLVSSLFAGFLSAFFTIPVLYSVMNVYRDNTSNSINCIQKLSNLLVSFGIHRQRIALDYNYPIFYCGLIQIVLLINLLLFHKNKKKKYAVAGVLLFFLISILSDFLILCWHGGSYPYGLLYRFSFLISFFLIAVSAENYRNYQPVSKKNQWIIISIYGLLLLFGYWLNREIDWTLIIINILFFYSNMVLLNINQMQKKQRYEISLIVFVLLELIFHIKCNFAVKENLRVEDQSTLNNQRLALYNIMDKIGNNTNRIDGKSIYYDNELVPMKKGSITLFLSSNNQNMFTFLNNSGYYAASSYTVANPYNYFLNSLLGVKYWYGYTYNSIAYQNTGTMKVNHMLFPIYENPYALSLGYLIEGNQSIGDCENPFEYQNNFSRVVAGKDIFHPLETVHLGEHTYEINLNHNDIYIYVESEAMIDFYDIYADIYINEKLVATENVMETIIKVKNDYPNQTAKIKLEFLTQLNDEPHIYFYEEDVEENLQILQQLQQKELKNVKISQNKLEGMIFTEKDTELMLTIPYEKGFTVLVDGKKTSYEKVYDTFLGIPLTQGIHTIQIQYKKPYGIEFGITISSCTVFLAVLHKIRSVKKSKV